MVKQMFEERNHIPFSHGQLVRGLNFDINDPYVQVEMNQESDLSN